MFVHSLLSQPAEAHRDEARVPATIPGEGAGIPQSADSRRKT